jgi:hypothetical protein
MKWLRSGLGLKRALPMALISCSRHKRAVGSIERSSFACSNPLPNLPAYRRKSDTPTF